jgi:hypothetical protein
VGDIRRKKDEDEKTSSDLACHNMVMQLCHALKRLYYSLADFTTEATSD